MPTIAPLLFEAENYLAQRDFDRAAALYQIAEELDGGRSALPRVGIARVAIAVGRIDDAERLLEGVLQRFPALVEAVTIRAVVDEARGHLDQGIRRLEPLMRADCRYAFAYVTMGRLLAQQQRWSEACARLQRATELLPDSVDALVLLGTALVRAGNAIGAAQALARAVQLAPEHLDANVSLADALVEGRELGLAEQVLMSAELRFPPLAIIASKRAAVAMRRGDLGAARVHARTAAERAPDDEEAQLLVATLAMAQLDLREAEFVVRRVLTKNPQSWRAHLALGGLFEAARGRERALTSYRRAVELAPAEWRPRNNLASLLMEEQTSTAFREAKQHLEQARANAGRDSFLVEYNLALACWSLGDRQASTRHAQACVRTGPSGHEAVQSAKRLLTM